jgi:hypothetical protein
MGVSRFEYNTLYVLYPFVTNLLTLLGIYMNHSVSWGWLLNH